MENTLATFLNIASFAGLSPIVPDVFVSNTPFFLKDIKRHPIFLVKENIGRWLRMFFVTAHSGRFGDMGSHFVEPHERKEFASDRRKKLLVAVTEAGVTNLIGDWGRFGFENRIWVWYRTEQSTIYGLMSLSSSSRFL